MQAKLTIRTISALKPAVRSYEVVDTDLSGFLLRIQPSGLMAYYLSYRSKSGKRKRYKIGRHGSITPIQARDIAQRLLGRVMAGEDIQADKQNIKTKAEQSKLQILEEFLDVKYGPWVKSQHKRGSESLKRIKFNFQELLSFPLHQITVWHIDKWRTNKLEQGRVASTVNRDIHALRGALTKAVEWGLIDLHPLAKLKSIKETDNTRIRYLSTAEEQRLRSVLNKREEKAKAERYSANLWRLERDYTLFPSLIDCRFTDYLQPMVLLSINTGLRQNEVFTLTWANVNFDISTLTVIGGTAKSRKTRRIPLNSEALDVLRDWHKQSQGTGLVFPNKEGTPFNNVRKSWASLLKEANIGDFHWHDMRHHFASCLVMAGVDLNTVRELLGHSDIKTTLRYAHLAPEHKAEAVAKLVTYKQNIGLCTDFSRSNIM